MKILDENNVEITSPDLSLGRLVEERLFVAHHPKTEAVEEIWHYETVTEYPNGGKDVKKVITTPGVQASEAWDEYEDILRYIKYTQKELDALHQESGEPSVLERVAYMESDVASLTAAIEKGLAL